MKFVCDITRYRMPLLGAFSYRPSVSPEPSAGRMPLLILWLSPTGYCCRERQNSSFVLEYTSSRVWFSSNMRSKLVGLRRIILVFICIFMRLVLGIFHAYSYDTYILVLRCMKQNKDAVWSLVLLLVNGVRADPKYSYSYDIICMCVRIVALIFH